ncbi:MAG: hypothetical protein Kow0068_23080 [Marinilabiliales bacterium]
MKRNFSNKEIIEGIVLRDTKVLEFVYFKYYKQFEKWVKKNNGNELDAEDIFQDVLVKMYLYLRKNRINIKDFGSYFISSCKRHYVDVINDQIIGEELDEDIIDFNADNDVSDIRLSTLKKALEKIKPDCRKILKLQAEGFSYQEISVIMKKFTPASVKTIRKRCIKELIIEYFKQKAND